MSLLKKSPPKTPNPASLHLEQTNPKPLPLPPDNKAKQLSPHLPLPAGESRFGYFVQFCRAAKPMA